MSTGTLAHIESIVFLQSVDLFAFCKAEEVLRIAGNDLADSVYCIVRGEVELTNGAGSKHVRGPLRTFGAVEIVSGRLRSGSAKALTDTLLLTLPAEDLFDLLANNIEIVKALFRYLIRELQHEQQVVG